MFYSSTLVSTINDWLFPGRLIKIGRPNQPDNVVFGIVENLDGYVVNYRKINYNGKLSDNISKQHINGNEYIEAATKEEIISYYTTRLEEEIKNDKENIRRLKKNINRNKRTLSQLDGNVFISVTEAGCTPDEAEKANRIINKQNKRLNKRKEI